MVGLGNLEALRGVTGDRAVFEMLVPDEAAEKTIRQAYPDAVFVYPKTRAPVDQVVEVLGDSAVIMDSDGVVEADQSIKWED